MKKAANLIPQGPQAIRKTVYDYLRGKILCGEIPPSSRLVELHLARELDVSRTPVREALHLLEQEGLVESIPRVGYLVKRIDANEVAEICEIRAVNESLAARWAMKRMGAKEIEALKQNLEAAEQFIKSGNLESFIELDTRFHQIIIWASGSSRLAGWCQSLQERMLLYRMEAFRSPGAAHEALNGHGEIFQGILDHDPSKVENAIHEHMTQGKRALLGRWSN